MPFPNTSDHVLRKLSSVHSTKKKIRKQDALRLEKCFFFQQKTPKNPMIVDVFCARNFSQKKMSLVSCTAEKKKIFCFLFGTSFEPPRLRETENHYNSMCHNTVTCFSMRHVDHLMSFFGGQLVVPKAVPNPFFSLQPLRLKSSATDKCYWTNICKHTSVVSTIDF